jgi:hypothetical protein
MQSLLALCLYTSGSFAHHDGLFLFHHHHFLRFFSSPQALLTPSGVLTPSFRYAAFFQSLQPSLSLLSILSCTFASTFVHTQTHLIFCE